MQGSDQICNGQGAQILKKMSKVQKLLYFSKLNQIKLNKLFNIIDENCTNIIIGFSDGSRMQKYSQSPTHGAMIISTEILILIKIKKILNI